MGQDNAAYMARFRKLGLATDNILIKEDAYNAQCFVTADQDNNQINAFHPGAMSYAHENEIAKAGPARIAIISPDGHLGMKKHATDLAKLNIPFIFDPGQQLPMFNGEELIDFIAKATYVTTNDYEIELLIERTGLTLDDIASRVEALIVTRGEQGSEIYTQGQIEIPAVPVDAALDPTGCGDAYRAGLLFGITNGWKWRPPAAWPACWAPSRSPTRARRTTASRRPKSPTSSKQPSATASKIARHSRAGGNP
jgi:adenosine kinase